MIRKCLGKGKETGGRKTHHQDQSLQKQGKAGETKATGGKTKSTGTKHAGTKYSGTKAPRMSQGGSARDHWKYAHGNSTEGAGLYTNPATVVTRQLYHPNMHPHAVRRPSAAAEIQMHTLGQTKGVDYNVPGGRNTSSSKRGEYSGKKSRSFDDTILRNQGNSSERYRLIGETTKTLDDPMETDDSDQQFINRNRNENQSHPMGIEYNLSLNQELNQLEPVHIGSRNPYQTMHKTEHCHVRENVPRTGSNYHTDVDRKNQEIGEASKQDRQRGLNTNPTEDERYSTRGDTSDNRHSGEMMQEHSEKQKEKTTIQRQRKQSESDSRRTTEKEADQKVRQDQMIQSEFNNKVQRQKSRDFQDKESESKTTTEKEADQKVREDQMIQSEFNNKVQRQKSRDFQDKESESKKKTEKEADQKVRQDQMIQSEFNKKIQRQESRDFHNFKDKKSFILHHCYKEHGSEPTVFIARLQNTSRGPENKVKKVEFGKKNSSCPEKVVMLVGSTGSGKSTMINAVVNYMFGIDWDDEYRLKLINEAASGHVVNQAVSQTGMITAYTIHHQPWFTVDYTLTIVDTPGFGDTGGLKRDKEIMEQIRKFFETQGSGGIDHLDGVGFVTQAAMPRLTPTQRYIFDSILSIFGKDIAQNIFMLLTFADGQKPQVLSGLKEANMKYQEFYKFNNSALYVGGKKKPIDNQQKGFSNSRRDASDEDSDDSDDDDDDESSFNQMFWKMGINNFNRFMRDLKSVKPQSLQLTAEVLQERNALEMTVNNIQESIKVGLRKLDQLKMEQQLLKSHQADIDKNRDFTYEVYEWMIAKEGLYPGEYAMNCSNCKLTCHLGQYKNMMGVWGALSFGKDCRWCPYKCPWSRHVKTNFKYIMVSVKVTKTSSQLKRRYEEATGKKLSAEQLIESCSQEFEYAQMVTLKLMERARECLKRLDEIALKPNPLSTTDYIDLMIQEEEFIAGPEWKVRQNNL